VPTKNIKIRIWMKTNDVGNEGRGELSDYMKQTKKVDLNEIVILLVSSCQ